MSPIAEGLHAVAAVDLELMRDDLRHRHRGAGMIAYHQADLHMAPAPAQVRDRVEAGHGAAERIDGDMRAALGDLLDSADHIGNLACIDGRHCAHLAREGELFFRQVDGDHVRTHGGRDHDGREPDTAAAMDRDPLAGLHAALIDDGAERGDKAAAEARGGGKIEFLGQRNEVRVGVVHRHIFRERAPGREAGLELLLADLMIAGMAFVAMSASADERHRDAVALLPACDVLSGRKHGARELVARHMRQHHIRVVPHPAMPVAPAQTRRLDLDHHAFCRGRRIRHVLHARRLAELLEENRFHDGLSPETGERRYSGWLRGGQMRGDVGGFRRALRFRCHPRAGGDP